MTTVNTRKAPSLLDSASATALLGRMTPAERAAGRFMRAPDGHEGGDGAGAGGAGEGAADGGAQGAAGGAEGGDKGAGGDAGAQGEGQGDGASGQDDPLAKASLLGEGGKAADAGGEGGAEGEGEAAAVEVKFDVASLAPPEGFEALDQAALKDAAPILAALGVDTTEKAQDTINKFAPVIAGMVERATAARQAEFTQQIVETRGRWADEARADPELGGTQDKFAENMTHAARFRDEFGTPELTAVLDETGLGNHPEFIRLFVRGGRAIGEGTFHRSTTAAVEKKTPGQRAYDPAFSPKE